MNRPTPQHAWFRKWFLIGMIFFTAWVCSGCQQFLQDYDYSPIGASQFSNNY